MRDTQLVMYDEDYRRILGVVQRLVRDANAKGIFVVDRNGQLIAEAGEMRGIDTTSLASLTAGCIAATGGLAKLVGEDDSRFISTRASATTCTSRWCRTGSSWSWYSTTAARSDW